MADWKDLTFESITGLSKEQFKARVPPEYQIPIIQNHIKHLKRQIGNPEIADKSPQLKALIAELESMVK